MKEKYLIKKINSDIEDFSSAEHWKDVELIKIEHYHWGKGGYSPKVFIKLMYSEKFVYVFFKVYENKIKVTHTNFASDVWKDSCVEFFINPFPKKSNEYINIEINAIGAMLIAKGSNRDGRKLFSESDVESFEIIPSIKRPVDGLHGEEYWTVHYKIPIDFFEKSYNEKFNGGSCEANFYKCGDETEHIHYGMWNNIILDSPDFHAPQYFGEIIFK